MPICPVPDSTTKFQVNATPATMTTVAPAPTGTINGYEACVLSPTTTVISGGSGSTTTTIYIQGPPGPKGDKGDDGCSLGMEWMGEWFDGMDYVAQLCPDVPNASVVQYNGESWICIQDHTSTETNFPARDDGQLPAPEGVAYWEILVEKTQGEVSLPAEDKSFFDKLKDGIFDWIENATIGDWIEAAAIGIGAIWAGSEILDMFSTDGTDPNAPITYNGSPGYSGAIEAASLKSLLSSLCDFCEVPYDVSAITDTTVSMPIVNNPKVSDVIAELSNVYQFDKFESGGVIKFVPRNIAAVREVKLTDVGFDTSTITGVPIVFKREQGLNLPRQVTIGYTSIAQEYGGFGQASQLLSFKEGNDIQVSTVCVLDDAYAKKLADITLVNANIQRTTITFTTTLDFIDIEVGDIINLETVGNVRVLSIEERDDGLLNFITCDAGTPDVGVLYSDPTGAISQPTTSTNVAPVIGLSATLFVDLPVLNASDKNIRLFAATHGYGKAGWPGANIYQSKDGGNTYSLFKTITQEATWGMVSGTKLPDVDYRIWDDTTTLTVVLKTGTLASATNTAVLNGANRLMVGQEMIAFGTATLVSTNTYQLSHLLRGRQGTDGFVSNHVDDELVVLIDGLTELIFNDDERTKTFKYKTVTIGGDISYVDAVDVQCLSNNWMPWRVANPVITKAGSDYVLNFIERLKFDNVLKDYTELTHDEDYTGFAVAILDNSNQIKRTTIVWANTYTYSVAEQITDFGIAQSSVKMKVVQMSTKVGGGHAIIINS